ncbi:MAG: hypothetical protein IKN72_00605 [Clostridia bacterium]|nr:hypothetical protein [Clostridia bacterium]
MLYILYTCRKINQYAKRQKIIVFSNIFYSDYNERTARPKRLRIPAVREQTARASLFFDYTKTNAPSVVCVFQIAPAATGKPKQIRREKNSKNA